jgi:Flp pilus assembly protein TadD
MAAVRWYECASRLEPLSPVPWLAQAEAWENLGHAERRLEALMGASARAPTDRRIQLAVGWALDDLGMCDEAYTWLCHAAHAATTDADVGQDGHPDGLFWRELGLFCLQHERFEEAREVAAYAELFYAWRGGRRIPLLGSLR